MKKKGNCASTNHGLQMYSIIICGVLRFKFRHSAQRALHTLYRSMCSMRVVQAHTFYRHIIQIRVEIKLKRFCTLRHWGIRYMVCCAPIDTTIIYWMLDRIHLACDPMQCARRSQANAALNILHRFVFKINKSIELITKIWSVPANRMCWECFRLTRNISMDKELCYLFFDLIQFIGYAIKPNIKRMKHHR